MVIERGKMRTLQEVLQAREAKEQLADERFAELVERVLYYSAFLGGTFKVSDLIGGTGLKRQGVLEVLKCLMEADAAKEKNGGVIIGNPHRLFVEQKKFEEVGSAHPKVYIIDFAYIQKRWGFNEAIRRLEEITFGKK